jgi:hypothetical protein
MPAPQAPDITKKTILYYPTITIPAGPWLRQALLYWDEIGSIVPYDHFLRSLVPYSDDIGWLANEGVFRPFDPELMWGSGGLVDEFKNELAETVASSEFRRLLPPKNTRRLSARVHKDKVSHEIYEFLEAEQLAREEQRDPTWYYFEHATALLYMAKLAKYLAAGDMKPTVIGTDLREYEDLNLRTGALQNGVVSLTAGFLNVLPVPREDVPMGDILNFKRRRHDQLLHFRQMLDDFESKLAACKTEVEAKNAIAGFSTKLQTGLADLEAALKDAKVATFWGSMESLIKTSSPAWLPIAAVAVGTAASIAVVPVSLAIGGAVVAGTIVVGKYLTDKRNERRAMMRQSQLSYFFQAKRDRIIA